MERYSTKKEVLEMLKEKASSSWYEDKENTKEKEAYLRFIDCFDNIDVAGVLDFMDGSSCLSRRDNSYNHEHSLAVVEMGQLREGEEPLYGVAFHMTNGDVRAGYSDFFIMNEEDFYELMRMNEYDSESDD